jgi:chromosome segregation ATPase
MQSAPGALIMTIAASSSLSMLLMLCLGACTLSQLNQDIGNRETRVGNKEKMLADDEARQAGLRAQMQQLEADLQQRQLSLDELTSGLDELQKQNALAAEQTRQQSARKAQMAQQLKQYQHEVDALRRNGNMSLDEKTKRLKHVQAEIRKALNLLLNS